VSNTLELLEKEIPKLKTKIKSVQLCFTTDPFMYGYGEVEAMSLAAIRKLNEASIACSVLTKGILPKELSAQPRINTYGITLISLNEDYRRRVEPGAAPYQERINALRELHDNDCSTWVSIEPYPTPNIIEQSIADILNAISFTDRIVFGRTNYNKAVSAYPGCKDFYSKEAGRVIRFCKEHGIDYYIKNGTITKTAETGEGAADKTALTPCAVAV
jgi:DNA repair photolyase